MITVENIKGQTYTRNISFFKIVKEDKNLNNNQHQQHLRRYRRTSENLSKEKSLSCVKMKVSIYFS